MKRTFEEARIIFTSESNDEGETTIMERPNNLPLGSSVNLGEIDFL